MNLLLACQNTLHDVTMADNINKCSAVAEMGDRLAKTDLDRKFGAVPLLFFGGGDGSPII